jgi:hypothetical protein
MNHEATAYRPGLTTHGGPMKDHWVQGEAACDTCMYFVCKPIKNSIFDERDEWLGRCRRHAPALGGYPVVFSNDWCGDHKLGVV